MGKKCLIDKVVDRDGPRGNLVKEGRVGGINVKKKEKKRVPLRWAW